MRLEDLIKRKHVDSTFGPFNGDKGYEDKYYIKCNQSFYNEKLENIYKILNYAVPEVQPSFEKLVSKMKNLDYSLISKDIKSEYDPLICEITERFYDSILQGILLGFTDMLYYTKQPNWQKRVDDLKTAIEKLASKDTLERFLEAYLRRVYKKFYDATGFKFSELLGIRTFLFPRNIDDIRSLVHKVLIRFLFPRDFNNIPYLTRKYLIELSMQESHNVADIVENLIKYPEQYKKDFDEYIGYKAEK